ncbi:MAG: hypothetical protein GC189_12285 [Alphaproteobacteria bacterium]|nr:hypothetical protein [Alphaproteobacteria bacterium]
MSHDEQTGRNVKKIAAAGFLGFATWCLGAPQSAIATLAQDGHQAAPIAMLAVGALGAHAAAAGLFAAFYRFKPATFPGFAASFLPILAADWWLYAKAGALNSFILAHAAGIIAISALCVAVFFAEERRTTIAERCA